MKRFVSMNIRAGSSSFEDLSKVHATVLYRLPLLVLIFLFYACEQLPLGLTAMDAKPSIRFSGISSAEMLKSDRLVIYWSAAMGEADDSIAYKVYLKQMSADAGTAQLQGISESPTVDIKRERTSKLLLLAPEISPSVNGQLLTTITDGSTSYEVPEELLPNKSYALQVVAVPADAPQTSFTKVPTLVISAGPLGDFSCLKGAEATGSREAMISIDYPPGASQVTVYRDGVAVFVADSPQNAFFDKDLSPRGTYRYTCSALVGDERYTSDKATSITLRDPLAELKEFSGCLSGSAIGASQIEVAYEFPETVSRISIMRGGLEVFSSEDKEASLTFVDSGLSEGVTYTYKCIAHIGNESRVGSRTLNIKTLSTNPPQFDGIKSVKSSGTNAAAVSWGVATGVPVKFFRIYASSTGSLSFSDEQLVATVDRTLSSVVEPLGDEVNYLFGVLACSADDACAGHSKSLPLTLADRVAPQTLGATSAVIREADAVITAPWNHTMGAVAKRELFYRLGDSAGGDINAYSLGSVLSVANTSNPPTALTYGPLVLGTYYFLVRDTDPSGNVHVGSGIASVTATDLTKPVFAGLTALNHGPEGQTETTLRVSFSPVNPSEGATDYLVYLLPGSSGNACTAGTKAKEFPVLGAVSPYVLNGLSPRSHYQVCLKARDAAGNISDTTTSMGKNTLDITPPLFDGISTLTYKSDNGRFTVNWPESDASDLHSYRLSVWKNDTVQNATLVHVENLVGSSFTVDTSTFSFTDHDRVYALVAACDDAHLLVGSSGKNCSQHSVSSAKWVQLGDITPPQDWDDVFPAQTTAAVTSNESEILVSWVPPPAWTDYAGFRVYEYDGSALGENPLATCPCQANPDCSDHVVSCLLKGNLQAYKTYRLHVRAYDLSGNETTYIPANSFKSVRTLDKTPPVFPSGSGLALQFVNPAIQLSWNAASDNQHADEPGAQLTYKLYKRTSPFADAVNPNEANLYRTQLTRSFADTNIVTGLTYYYTVCAVDASSNRTCPGTVVSYVAPDTVPPVISSFSAAYTTQGKVWDLSWVISDNISANANIDVEIRQANSESGTPPADVSQYTATVYRRGYQPWNSVSDGPC